MILVRSVNHGILQLDCHQSYHKFVKTTPKPSATKKSSGELDPPFPLPFPPLLPPLVGVALVVAVPVGGGDDTDEAMFVSCRAMACMRDCKIQKKAAFPDLVPVKGTRSNSRSFYLTRPVPIV